MSGHQYINSRNLFADDEDVDDETFLRGRGGSTATGSALSELERQRQTMLQRQHEIEQRTLDSSARSLGLLRDSEQIGVATAEELMRQREQLDSTSRRLDDINTNLRTSQKHLNGIKSVFNGLKNYLSGRSDSAPPRSSAPPPDSRSGSALGTLVESAPQLTSEERYNSHPATRLYGLDKPEHQPPVTDSRRVNELLDANLDEMVYAITRLKGLGTELGREIESQNSLLDNIHDKVEVADITINKQNKQMNKLLGK